MLWRKHKLIWAVSVEYECIALAFHTYGNALVVGTTAGHLLVLNVENGETVSTVRVCAAALNCLAYNQGEALMRFPMKVGNRLAFGMFRWAFSNR